MKTVLLISGKQGSGKTTTAEAIYRALVAPGSGCGFVNVMKFAGHLYKIHEFVLNYMERITGKPRSVKDGYFLQWLGTEYGRKNWGDDVWVDAIVKEINDGPFDTVIVDDARFENEFDAFPNAVRVRLDAPAAIRKERCEATAPGSWRDNENHPSEIGLDRYALEGKFDAVYPTHLLTTEAIVAEVLKLLEQKRNEK